MPSHIVRVTELAEELAGGTDHTGPWDDVVAKALARVGAGGTVVFDPRRDYFMRHPLVLEESPRRLHGDGPALPGRGNSVGHAARLRRPPGVPGLWMRTAGHELRDMALVGPGWNRPERAAFGLRMSGNCIVERVFVGNWSVPASSAAFEITADKERREFSEDGDPVVSNANGWTVKKCVIRQVGGGGHGFYVHGGDTNAGYHEQVQVSDVMDGGKGIWVDPQIGGTGVMSMVHMHPYSTARSHVIESDGWTEVSPYTESRRTMPGQSRPLPNRVSGNSVVLHGKGDWETGGRSVVISKGQVRNAIYVAPIIRGRPITGHESGPVRWARLEQVFGPTPTEYQVIDFYEVVTEGRVDFREGADDKPVDPKTYGRPLDPKKYGHTFVRHRGASNRTIFSWSWSRARKGGGRTKP